MARDNPRSVSRAAQQRPIPSRFLPFDWLPLQRSSLYRARFERFALGWLPNGATRYPSILATGRLATAGLEATGLETAGLEARTVDRRQQGPRSSR